MKAVSSKAPLGKRKIKEFSEGGLMLEKKNGYKRKVGTQT